MELTIDQALQQGVAAHKEGKLQEAERLYRAILQTQPKHPDANHNLGVLSVSSGKSAAALPLFKTALGANPNQGQFWLSYIDALIKEKQFENAKEILAQGKKSGLSEEKVDALSQQLTLITQAEESTLPEQKKSLTFAEKRKKLSEKKKKKKAKSPSQPQLSSLLEHYQNGRYGDAEKLALSMTKQFPRHQFSWKVLGAVLQETGRVSEKLVANQKSVELAPQDAEAHNNLGATLQELDRIEEAEASYRQAIALKPDFAKAHTNLGTLLYGNGDICSALECLEKADGIDPKLKTNKLILTVLQARKAKEETEVSGDDKSKLDCHIGLNSNPLVLNRVVEAELINNLYEMNSRELDKTKDGRYGNGRCSLDFALFEDERFIMKTVAEDIISIMRLAVKSDVYVYDSFFNILGAGGGSIPHDHLKEIDKYPDFAKQKYSLVYYLSVGDQNCSEPGILKLYDPNEDILPCEGMIVIIPGDRQHSAVYGGKKDRVMIGVNFYSL